MEQKLAEGLVDALHAAGVNFITYLPETRLSEIIPLLQSDPSFQMVPVGSEAEGVSISGRRRARRKGRRKLHGGDRRLCFLLQHFDGRCKIRRAYVAPGELRREFRGSAQ